MSETPQLPGSEPALESAPISPPESGAPSPVPVTQLEESPMLDVHPPHQSVHTWTDFFIHMATIVLGLLIAIGLEQSVEAVHHSQQRRELRESLERESRQILKDSIETAAAETIYLDFDEERIAQMRDPAWGHGVFPNKLPTPKVPPSDFPDDPIWRSAKTSGLADLLTQPEINAYSEIELLIEIVRKDASDTADAVVRQHSFENQLPRQKGSSDPDFSVLSLEDRRQYLAIFANLAAATRKFRSTVSSARGAEEAILRGERDLNAIFKAERAHTPSIVPENK